MVVESGKPLVFDCNGQGIAVRKETQQPNLLHDLDEREHGTPCACSPEPTVRHIVSDDVDLISQPGDLCEERSRSFGILLVPAANVLPNIVYPSIQCAPHRRRSEDIIYQR